MEILVIGEEQSRQECSLKFGDRHFYHFAKSHAQAVAFLKPETIVFDFKINEIIGGIDLYKGFNGIAFLDLSKNSLRQLTNSTGTGAVFFGFCGMPTLLNRQLLEVALSREADLKNLEEVCRELNTKFAIVKDQVGLVTPRVICMIINEAYFSIQENIASREDIDLAMKLGTNYPFGPFEWCGKIGLKNVYELLRAVYENTKDDRYKVCELLKKEALH